MHGSFDRMIRICDVEIDEAVGAPLWAFPWFYLLQTRRMESTLCLVHMIRITFRLWDTGTGRALSAPLRGHSGVVASVSSSPRCGLKVTMGTPACK